MHTFKKLMVLVAPVVIVALAIPAVASASPKPTLVGVSSNKPVAAGTEILVKGFNVKLTESIVGTISCEKLNTRGTLKSNSDTYGFTVSGPIDESPEQAGCKNSFGAVTVNSVTPIDLYSSVDGSLIYRTKETITVGTRMCTISKMTTIGYTNGATSFAANNSNGFEAGACGEGTVDGTLTLETASGEKVKAIY